MFENLYDFVKKELDIGRVMSLAELLTECEKQNVGVEKVVLYMNGFMVVFSGISGDAILHDGSYGRLSNEWETIGMPWDGDDVSVHSAKDLARLLGQLVNNAD